MGSFTTRGKNFISTIQLAVSFLTIIPLYKGELASEREMGNSLRAFPLVGGIIGLLLAGVYFIANQLHMGIGGTGLVVIIWLIITGGLHGDGVMDTADGVFSGKERMEKLEIMRDSRVGAMGVMAFISIVILKICFLASLPVDAALWALTLSPMVGRVMMLYAMLQFPYARQGGGLGNRFGVFGIREKSSVAAAVVVTVAVMLTAVSHWQDIGVGLLVFFVACAVASGFVHWVAWILGGHTGDSYGAVCEVSEVVALMVILVYWGAVHG